MHRRPLGLPKHPLQSGPVALTSPGREEPILQLFTQPSPDETHDHNPRVYEPYTTSLQQRQQQAAEFYRTQHNYSRASTSSGSAAHSLRRTPNFEEARPRFRSSSVDSPPQPPQRAVRFAEHLQPSPQLDASARSRNPDFFAPHPALRISRRTASAIRFVLEEAIRLPHTFTPDLAEEHASMSDLPGGNGRAANGGARAGGPVPVTQSDRSNIRTPQMIMHERREREARRKQTEADEQQKAEEERRRNAERRAQAAGVAGAPTSTESGAQRLPAFRAGTEDSGYGTYPTAGVLRQPERVVPTSAAPPITSRPPDTASGTHGRPRASSQSQQQPRPVQSHQPTGSGASESRRPPPAQHARRPSAPAGSSQAGPSTAAPPPLPPPVGSSSAQARQSTTSTFPHAFERWETLSSHWEGLTSYWIRRLEQNTDEVRREPLAQQMSRQITDLSAAGANLFHAVVELQRLRASSERKFQRWFYEHRQEQERAQEREAHFENTLRVEREARADAVANMERMGTEKKNAERMVQEMKRELQISKEEARRAWEELGRREQEERDRTFSLREGQPTVIGGVQVVPTAQGMGRHGGGSQRAHSGEDVYGAGPSGGHDIDQQYSYEEGQSPTDTDPFTEGRYMPPRRPEPDVTPVAHGTYVPSGAEPSAGPSRRVGSSQAPDQPPVPAPLHPRHQTTNVPQPTTQPSTSNPEAFYQQPEAYLHRDTDADIPEDERSGVTSHGEETSEGDEEYAIDEYGNYILDQSGRRVPFRALRERDSDEFDVQEDRRREIEHLQRYGTAATDPSSYATTSTAGPSQQGGYVTTNVPDYSGAGYGSEWMGMRHHHPTRLSDVMEEDERSRTSPSRASQASRGIYQ